MTRFECTECTECGQPHRFPPRDRPRVRTECPACGAVPTDERALEGEGEGEGQGQGQGGSV